MRIVLGVALALVAISASAQEPCPPTDYSLARLQQMKTDGFMLADASARQVLAVALTACLGDPRPELRDGIAFEALSTWMRKDLLDLRTRQQLRDALVPMLTADDAEGFRAPFAALVLSEVARTDRVKPWLSVIEREALVQAAARYLSGVRDYRGFSHSEGWRHGVAHGADLALQLVLNPALTTSQLDRLLAAVASQVAPSGTTAYHSGEPARLARPVLYAAQRGMHEESEWTRWLDGLLAPAPLASWDQAFASEAGLARRHNTMSFLLALYFEASESEDARVRRLLPGLREGLRKLR